jgi:hypothetical protein
MRERLISALAYPRSVVRGYLEPDDCPHNSSFDREDRRCLNCEFEMECMWLCNNDEFAALQLRPMEDLVDALEFSLDYVSQRISEPGHHSATCRCDACTWSREAGSLIETFRNP